MEFFANIPAIARKLQTLVDVGLGYIALGQPATTLSGGEAQRIKLASELSRRPTGRTLYILDEPTTGLHMADVEKLLDMLHALVDAGNSMVVIEHNLDVIKNADWLIDMGPEGGDAGGQIVAEGTPEQVAKNKASYTGQYLQKCYNNYVNRSELEPWMENLEPDEFYAALAVHALHKVEENRKVNPNSRRLVTKKFLQDYIVHIADPTYEMSLAEEAGLRERLRSVDPETAAQLEQEAALARD